MSRRGGASADANFNVASNNGVWELKVQNNDNISESRKTYLRFDLTGVTGSPVAVDLTLQVRIGNAMRISVYGLNDGEAGDGASENGGWAESAVTWNNAPANDVTTRDGVLATAATLLGTFDMADTGSSPSVAYVFSNGALRDSVKKDSNSRVTLILTESPSIGGDGGVAANFWSKEHTPSGGAQGDLAPALNSGLPISRHSTATAPMCMLKAARELRRTSTRRRPTRISSSKFKRTPTSPSRGRPTSVSTWPMLRPTSSRSTFCSTCASTTRCA